ncbi:phosphomevalonate kinase [Nakaseomyces bracarensis]|uniref:phosphomevalonate kinase n=1 Tax=Nakaseomyces bracarensis TaxID=273131 RepID=UPI003872017B
MSVAFSAPGKVLLAGGYLVLEPQYNSYVLAVSSRMHAVVKGAEYDSSVNGLRVTVTSPQFNGDQWEYDINSEDGYIPQERHGKKNPFLEKTILNVLNDVIPRSDGSQPNKINIEIYSDAGYHSQKNSITKINQYRSFQFHKSTITDVPKTGLGSSAGLVVVVTCALLSCFISIDSVDECLDHIHNLAQISHCQAQGKIGSGFDVAAATYGSIKYRRFLPELISSLPILNKSNVLEYQQKLSALLKSDWKVIHTPVTLPRGLRLILGDVNNGSETVQLVKKVKSWYVENLPRSQQIYDKINEGNERIIESMLDLEHLRLSETERYNQLILDINNGDIAKQVEISSLRKAIEEIRSNFRVITKESGAEIEPESQTHLLDACLKLNGVIGGVVPGAGGYDAISLITTQDIDIKKEAVGEEFSSVTWLDLHQEDVGVKKEIPQQYEDLK